MNRADKNEKNGFTLVELLLAMTFISVLLLMIAITVIQISNTYNKGLTLRAVNQAGRSVTTDIRRVIAESQPFDVDSENSFVHMNDPSNSESNYGGGRLCTGSYTYVWNFGRSLVNDVHVNVYDSSDTEIHFVRVRDSGGEYCANRELAIRFDDAKELLTSADHNLAVQSFAINRIADDPVVGQSLYRIKMAIGTNDAESLDTIDTECRPPSDDRAVQDFCAVNHFDFTVQAGYKGGL